MFRTRDNFLDPRPATRDPRHAPIRLSRFCAGSTPKLNEPTKIKYSTNRKSTTFSSPEVAILLVKCEQIVLYVTCIKYEIYNFVWSQSRSQSLFISISYRKVMMTLQNSLIKTLDKLFLSITESIRPCWLREPLFVLGINQNNIYF